MTPSGESDTAERIKALRERVEASEDALKLVDALRAALSASPVPAERATENRFHIVYKGGCGEATIGVLEPAHTDGLRVSGSFGALAPYALDVEIGTSRIGPTTFARVAGSGGWWSIPGPAPAPGVSVRQSFTILPPGGGYGFSTIGRSSIGTGPMKQARPYLRPAAYTQFPLLPFRVAAAFKGEEMM